MPSHTIHAALTQMYYDVPGAPWIYPTWKELTKHGLFPENGDQLPEGCSPHTARGIVDRPLGATYPRLSLTDVIPHFESLEDWQSQTSSKVDICARMCLHLLSRDDAPAMIFEDGQVTFPEIPQPLPGESVLRDTKILLYQEFPSFGPLLRNVFSLYGIPHLHIDGQMSFDHRAKIVDQFISDPSIRVLIFSSVGSTGLNLSRANVVIFLDQPRSAQDERQIQGRTRRQPQTKRLHNSV